jgi:hypothetical protein
MIFKLAEAADKSWRRLDGHNPLPKLILGVLSAIPRPLPWPSFD